MNENLTMKEKAERTDKVIRLFQKALPFGFLISLLDKSDAISAFVMDIERVFADTSLSFDQILSALPMLGYVFGNVTIFGTIYVVLEIYRRVNLAEDAKRNGTTTRPKRRGWI